MGIRTLAETVKSKYVSQNQMQKFGNSQNDIYEVSFQCVSGAQGTKLMQLSEGSGG